jgi:putative ABC transport system permease protein
MIRNYFTIGLRNLLRNKGYAFINIGGLAVGLACFIIIMLFVQHELSYDKFYPNADRIYSIYQKQSGNVFMRSDLFAVTPIPLAAVLEDECPEVAKAVSISDQHALVGVNNRHSWEHGLAASPHFFDVLAFDFIRGNPATAFNDTKSIVLTASLAQKIFPNGDITGQRFRYEHDDTYTVTGVIADPPLNSSLQFSYIVNIHSLPWYANEMTRSTWQGNRVHTFLLLHERAEAASLQARFAGIIKKHQDPEGYADYTFQDEYFLQPLSGLHLQSGVNFDIGLKGNRQYIYLFSGVAFIILMLACINYMSLAVARSIRRAQEVGIRRAIGAQRFQIIVQFLGESILIAFFALLLALLLVNLTLPWIGSLLERPIVLDFFGNVWLLPALLILLIAVGLFAGSYPSFFLSSLRPIQVLKGKMKGGPAALRFQRVLIVAQYVVSISLIISSAVIYRQIQYMKNTELGYERENIITMPLLDRPPVMQNYETLVTTWKQHPAVVSVTASSQLPVNIASSTIINDDGNKDNDLAIYECSVNRDFLAVFGITLLNGRDFSSDVPTDEKDAVLLNETAAKALGWTPDEAIGKQFSNDGTKTVIGVVKDFHMHSMHLAIEPLMLRLNTFANYIAVKIQPGHEKEVIALLETSIKKYSSYPVEYHFLSDQFNQLYSTEMKMGELFGFFTIVSILIASLGLFGLAAFSAGQRTKEIGIRKTFGASAQNIVVLLTKGFIFLIVIAFVLSVPVSWFIMQHWLQGFAYHVTMPWWMFAAAGTLALAVAAFAISFQSLRAARIDPAKTLKE